MLTSGPGFAITLQLRVRVRGRVHLSPGQFGGTYRFLFGQVPQMFGKCPMSDCNFILCMSVASCMRQNYMAMPTTHFIDQSARNYSFHSSVTSVRFSKCDWLATCGITNNTYHTSVCIQQQS